VPKKKPFSGGYVVVEDFGTTGLEGDVEQWEPKSEENRFFNFVRAEALSGNSLKASTGGSWGVGKTVFNRCSSINSFLALTVRRTTRDLAVFGRSMLRYHRIAHESATYQARGLWGTQSTSTPDLTVPCQDEPTAEMLIRDFGLRRSAQGDAANAGLSVVIPYADEEITADGIADIALREYFYPILAGKLVVEVYGDFNDGSSSVVLTRENLPEHAAKSGVAATKDVIELATRALHLEDEQVYVAPAGGLGAPDWSTRLFPDDDERFAELCRQFDQGDCVSIRVPITLHPKEGDPESDSFVVHVRRDLDGQGYRPLFVRGWTVVANARKRGLRNHRVFALTTIDKDAPLGKFLRLSEPPAHTSWEPDTTNIKGRFAFAKPTIDFVLGAPKYIVDCLANTRRDADTFVWSDLFPVPGDSPGIGRTRKKQKRKKGGVVNPPVIAPPPAKPKAYRIEKMVDGFVVVRDNKESTPLPVEIRIMTGYDRSRGNPIKSHSNHDFNLQNMTLITSNVREFSLPPKRYNKKSKELSFNRIFFTPLNDEFRVEVTGFDARRDLVVIGRSESGKSTTADTDSEIDQ
jgi:hypothetical protein